MLNSTNNTKTQAKVIGWRNVTSTAIASALQQYCTLLVNDELRIAKLRYNRQSMNVNASGVTSALQVDSKYRPYANYTIMYSYAVKMTLESETGNIKFENNASQISIDINREWIYSY